MSRKNKKSRKERVKHKKYVDQNFSTIDQHHMKGKVLSSAFKAVPNLSFSSWLEQVLPDLLWAAILATHLDRNDYLDLFRRVVKAGREDTADYSRTFITHSVLSTLPEDEFDKIFAPLIGRDDVRLLLSSLLLLEQLPDRMHWQRWLPNDALESAKWEVLAQGIMGCLDHQSQRSTDCRWLKMIYMLAIGKVQAPEETVMELVEYPNRGDMRSVRPTIRAMEMAFRGPDLFPETPQTWSADFWVETWEKTPCHLPAFKPPSRAEDRTSLDDVLKIYPTVVEHFHATISHTGIDARHDATFGLALYSLYLLAEFCQNTFANRATSRIALRSMVEAFITLRFLSSKDDPTIWMQYRNYGQGQSKLSFLKYVESGDVPDFVSVEDLEMHANADMWMEFQDIKLGNWADKNLRKMSEEASIKDIYDKYYDWPSGFVHANWAAVRDSTFTICLNPLHRFHRVATMPRTDMNDILADGVKVANLTLDEVNKLYPSFKPRIRASKMARSAESASASGEGAVRAGDAEE